MIRLTKQTDYGIVLLCAMAAEEERRWSASELSQRTHLPLPMVSKILKTLARQGLLESQRGVKGGYELAQPASQISVAQMIAAVEGPIAITECNEESSDECSYEALCLTRRHWQTINRAVKEALERITLADMASPELRMPSLPRAASAGAPLVTLGSSS